MKSKFKVPFMPGTDTATCDRVVIFWDTLYFPFMGKNYKYSFPCIFVFSTLNKADSQ